MQVDSSGTFGEGGVSEKTSATHPLAIYSVTAPGGGYIGTTMCPGKRQPNAVTGPWNRDLAADLDAIKTFGANTVISLMEEAEMAEANVPVELMRTAVESRGMEWIHIPIPDFGVPSALSEAAWTKRGPGIRGKLLNGERIVAHCRGGRGRAGLMAAKILVELGIPGEEAIKAVRAANPLAIETVSQEDYVRQCRPQTE